jgi:propanol-preferring alcohol dehydrogenase
VRVRVCGVCRTDLHLAEGDLPPRDANVHRTPGHEIVGTVDAVGRDVAGLDVGQRVGVPWLAHTCGVCTYCRRGDENLCVTPTFTGWDVDGGYADYAVAHHAFVYPLPDELDDLDAAPMLCSGIIGYRALGRAGVPPGGALGIYGFGASAHLTAQIALAQGMRVHVLTRSVAAQQLALDLGCHSAAGADDAPPEQLDGAVLFAPVGTLVPPALAALDRGATLSIAGIYLTDIPARVRTPPVPGTHAHEHHGEHPRRRPRAVRARGRVEAARAGHRIRLRRGARCARRRRPRPPHRSGRRPRRLDI